MLHKFITKKIIYFNLSIIFSLFFISFFFRPNLTTKVEYRFNEIFINEKLLILSEIVNENVLTDVKFIDSINPSRLNNFIYRYFQNLADEKNERVYKNCPTEITKAYFKDLRVNKVGRHFEKFSVEIKYNSALKGADEEIKKCFQVIFVEQLNIYYLENLKLVKKNINILINKDKVTDQNSKAQNAFRLFKLEERINALNYLNEIRYLVSPQLEIKPIIIKSSISYIIFYLVIIFLFFIIQIFYIFNKKFFNLKKFSKII